MKWSCQISNEGVLYILFYIRRFAHWPILETKMRGATSLFGFAVAVALGRNGLP
jgi:hypothetical protein